MAEFYTWAEAARIILTLLISLTVLLQTLAMVLSFHRYHSSRSRDFENLLELCVLVHILACSLLHGQIVENYYNSLITPTGYGVLRIACFAAVSLVAFIVLLMTGKTGPLFVAAASALTLPMMELIFGNVFAWLYLTAFLFWLARSIHICIRRYREIKTNLSALSIKNTIDSLHTGVLFSEPNGSILLINAQMQRLMETISGRISRNGNHFYELLVEGDMEPNCQRSEFQGQIVCLLPDDTAWMFTRSELQIKRKKHIQLTSTDITQRWTLTEQLRWQEDQLKIKGEELSREIANLHILSREKETQKAKMRAHDILGQRLTILLRTIRSEQALDYDLLRSLSQELLGDLKADKNEPPPQDELLSLQQAFGSIGVDIELDGTLPEDCVKGRLFTDIIRESVTNAVRHGFATKILVQIGFSGGGYHLRITNNGYPPAQPIVEGGGIGGMRKMLEPNGGALKVTAHPHFVLTVDLPGG